jgi:hypothetical protein
MQRVQRLSSVLELSVDCTGMSIEKMAKTQQPKNQPTPPNVMPPIAPRRRPFRPHFTYLFRLVLTRSRCAQLRT